MLHDYTRSEKDSNSPIALKFWVSVYNLAYSGINHIEKIDDEVRQKQGQDKIIHLNDNTQIRIEEKIRWEDYDDFALEYLSSFEHSTPGWMEKNLITDYLAYGFYPSGRAYLIPWQELKKAWEIHKHHWKKQYFNPPAINKVGASFYTTMSVAVPIKVIHSLIPSIKFVNINEPILEHESSQTLQFDLYDQNLEFRMRYYPLNHLVNIAMQSSNYDKLTLYLSQRCETKELL